MFTEDEVRTKDRAWRATAFLVVIANLVLAAVELRHYGRVHEDAALGTSNTWTAIASVPLLLSMFLPLRRSTTPWRIACVAVLALSFVVRLVLLITH